MCFFLKRPKYQEIHKKYSKNEHEYALYLIDHIDCEVLEELAHHNLLWYIRKSKQHKFFYFFCMTFTIAADAATAVFAYLSPNGNNLATIILPLVAGALVSLSALFRYHDNWTRYREAAERMMDTLTEFEFYHTQCRDHFSKSCKGCQFWSPNMKEHDDHTTANDKSRDEQACNNGEETKTDSVKQSNSHPEKGSDDLNKDSKEDHDNEKKQVSCCPDWSLRNRPLDEDMNERSCYLYLILVRKLREITSFEFKGWKDLRNNSGDFR